MFKQESSFNSYGTLATYGEDNRFNYVKLCFELTSAKQSVTLEPILTNLLTRACSPRLENPSRVANQSFNHLTNQRPHFLSHASPFPQLTLVKDPLSSLVSKQCLRYFEIT